MEEKKKRGRNYTVAEKDILLELVKKYRNVIENKETNASIILKKREAWESVTHQYNAVAASGCRTWQQLRHLYENLKQRSKKNIAKANVMSTIQLFYNTSTAATNSIESAKLDFYFIASMDRANIILLGKYFCLLKEVLFREILNQTISKLYTERRTLSNEKLQFYKKTKDVNDAKIKASVDKKEINRTDGGSYRSSLTDHDAQILTMVAPQIQPLSNPYDDAALYYGDTDSNIKNETEVEASSDIILNVSVDIDDQDIKMSDICLAGNSKPCTATTKLAGNQEVTLTTTSTTSYEKHTLSTPASKSTERVKPNKKSNIKEQYFKAKLRNAKLENKYLINKNKMEINKYKIEMKILKLRLKLQSSNKNNK